ncbi:hypothetical protein ACLB2K_073616 [Fragaria x ananassa]
MTSKACNENTGFTGEKGGRDGGNDSSSDDFEGDAGDTYETPQHLDRIGTAPDDSNTAEMKDIPTEIDFEEEADISRKVLKNLTTSSCTVTLMISEIDFEEEADISRKVLKNLTTSSCTVTTDDMGVDNSVFPKGNKEPTIDFGEEADIARKVLKKFTMASGTVTAVDDSLPKSKKEPTIEESVNEPSKLPSETAPNNLSSESASASDAAKPQTEEEDDLHRTIFISNLPFEITYEEVKQKFSAFGQVQSFVPVLHPLTKRPKGTGFLKFKTIDAVTSAVSAGSAASGLGIFPKATFGLEHRPIVEFALDNVQKLRARQVSQQTQQHAANEYKIEEVTGPRWILEMVGVSISSIA